MELEIDPDVKAVAEFMQSNMPAAKLVSVASAIAALAPILWGKYEAESVFALRLIASPLNAVRAGRILPCAKSPAPAAGADDGSEVEAS